MDNLYNSEDFLKTASNNKKKVPTRGFMRKESRGILSCITQEDLKSDMENIETRGTIKAEVTGRDKNIRTLLNLVCIIPSLYTTPVWFQNS